ncbi:MAG TPA: aldo/keto reductase, partial [Candidatus Eisenbacteria bacterium]|nr:aldo/keto reductase [Candidatus Eisenbacteria bacterium]
MDPTATRRIGRTDVAVTQLGFGGASIGELFHKVPEEEAVAAVRAAWEDGLRFFDTAPWYGRGLSELRVGAGLRDRPRSEYILSTKVGRWLRPNPDPAYSGAPWLGGLANDVVFDYTYDGIMRSVEQSRQRLGVARYDVAVIHDLDYLYHGTGQKIDGYFIQLATSGWRALTELKAAGEIRAIAAGINELGLITRFLDLVDVDAFLVAMPYTLLRQEVLDDEFPAAVERGCSFIIGAPFQSGILATGSANPANSDYAPPDAAVIERVRRIEAVCARHEVPLAAAALQFPLGHPSVAAVIPGARTAAQVRRNTETFSQSIPADLW